MVGAITYVVTANACAVFCGDNVARMKHSKAVAGYHVCSRRHRNDTDCGGCDMHRAQRGHVPFAHTCTARSREHMNETWLHVTSQNNKTALMFAAANGATDVAKLLIDHGADVNAVDEVRCFGGGGVARMKRSKAVAG